MPNRSPATGGAATLAACCTASTSNASTDLAMPRCNRERANAALPQPSSTTRALRTGMTSWKKSASSVTRRVAGIVMKSLPTHIIPRVFGSQIDIAGQ